MDTEIRVELRIVGDFDPQEISKKLNMHSYKQWNFGEPINKNRNYNCNGWIYRIPSQETLFVCDQTDKLMTVFSSHVETIKGFSELYDLNVCIDIVVEIYNKEVPSIFFSRDFLEFTESIGATIDVDMYLHDDIKKVSSTGDI